MVVVVVLSVLDDKPKIIFLVPASRAPIKVNHTNKQINKEEDELRRSTGQKKSRSSSHRKQEEEEEEEEKKEMAEASNLRNGGRSNDLVMLFPPPIPPPLLLFILFNWTMNSVAIETNDGGRVNGASFHLKLIVSALYFLMQLKRGRISVGLPEVDDVVSLTTSPRIKLADNEATHRQTKLRCVHCV